jgi:5,10-methylenetetrahydromethanopterin reductase
MSIRFGLRIPPYADVREVTAAARGRGRGLRRWRGTDSQFLWRDVWAAIAVAATATERIALGTCVTQFEQPRHPTVTATAAATIDEVGAPSGPVSRSSSGAAH